MPLRLTASMRVIAWRLVEGRRTPVDELIDALWGDCADGGPLTADNCIKVHVCRLRRQLREFGIPIRVIYKFGYLVPAEHLFALRAVLADEIARSVLKFPDADAALVDRLRFHRLQRLRAWSQTPTALPAARLRAAS